MVLQKETHKLAPDSPVRVMLKVAGDKWALKCSETNSSKMSGLSCQAFLLEFVTSQLRYLTYLREKMNTF